METFVGRFMKHGHKAAVTKLWNDGMNEDDIGDKLNIPTAEVIAFLKTRLGYPRGEITTRDHRTFKDREAFRTDDAQHTKYGITPKPTLPKLKFLGE